MVYYDYNIILLCKSIILSVHYKIIVGTISTND